MITGTTSDNSHAAAENLRLSLAKLGQLNLPTTAVNYALVYFYVSGQDLELNTRLDEIFSNMSNWSDDQANELFTQYICQCTGEKNHALEQDLLLTITQILGLVVELAGRTASSSGVLEKHLEELAASREPEKILKISSGIVAETRKLVEETDKFESTLRQSTQEIEQLKGELDDARKQATIDSLTALNNRRGFDKALAQAVESVDSEQTFCLMLIDIDNFKLINDTHGHLVGDKVLVGIAQQLTRQMRGNDYLSRFGGEEFSIILLDTPITGAFTVAEKLRKSIVKLSLKHAKTGQKVGMVTVSVGVASYKSGESPKGLIERCDAALYRAKSLGRDRTVIAD